ncbi:Superoxide dismutase [Cu-Zn] precursor [Pantoea agglomerans]|uniref:Superoxide dismutase [Cu-Zn] n=1 Tax=Enterobacter agglomerans TaxID=549 RepID=A0A379AGR3_ENTAG|nr:Superoxide dismutase [Cu-Zn] precursor [Pantoea agglomerans]
MQQRPDLSQTLVCKWSHHENESSCLIRTDRLRLSTGCQRAGLRIHQVTAEGIGKSLGTVKIDETQYGLQFTPDLQGLQPGIHGFHVHAKGSCEPGESEGKVVAAGAAGGHLDPAKQRPNIWGLMQRGTWADLPAVYVDDKGSATYPVLAPRLKSLKEIKGKSADGARRR